MAVRRKWLLRIIACATLLIGQFAIVGTGGYQAAAATTCPYSANGQPPVSSRPVARSPLTTQGSPSALPDTGAGGGVAFCAQNPDQCPPTAGGGGNGPPSNAAAGTFAPDVRLAYSGSSPGRGRSRLLMFAPPILGSGLDRSLEAGDPCTLPPADPGGGPAPIPCPPQPGPPPLPDARRVALGIAVPYPDIQIGINPSPLGLTGLPSWFWVQGYDGRTLRAATTVSVPPQVPAGYPGGCPQPPGASLDVAVQFSPASYDWTFGDRLPTSTLSTTLLGEGYPRSSSIQHVYEYTSLGRPDGFAVSVTVHFRAQYQANGNAWQALPDVAKAYTRSYPVQQAQSVLVNGR